MKRHTAQFPLWYCLAALFLAFQQAAAGALHVPVDDPKKDVAGNESQRHQGTWRTTSFVWDGQESSQDVVRSIRRIVDGKRVVWKRDGQSFAGTTVELDPAKEPKTIDVIPEGGPSMGKRVLGIYKLDGDTLTICMAGVDQERPKEFKAEKGSGNTLMTFQRERAEK